jgi:hypothetical protein
MKKLTISMFALLVLSACGTKYNVPYNQKEFDKGGKAFIVIAGNNNLDGYNGQMQAKNRFEFKNGKGDIIKLSALQSDVAKAMVPAGTWTLVKYELYNAMTAGKMKYTLQLDLSRFAGGSFSVKDGEVAYLGLVDTIVLKGGDKIEVSSVLSDDFAERQSLVDDVLKETGLKLKSKPMNWKNFKR